MQRTLARWGILLLIVAVISAIAIVATGDDPEVSAETLTIHPVADAWVDEEQPNENFGSDTSLEVDGSSIQQAFLRFDVAGVDETVTAATLRLYVENPSVEKGGSVATSSDLTWDEMSITWETRPAIDGPVIATSGAIERATWVEFDVTAGIAGNGPVTFVITTGVSDGSAFASRESDTPPDLVITHGSGELRRLTPMPVQGGTQRSTATPGDEPSATMPSGSTPTPDAGPVPMPGSVEAENFRSGGEGVGYHDTSAGNNGGEYRHEDVDIQACEDESSGAECFNISYIRAGEWLAYDLVFAEDAEYVVTLRAASWNTGRAVHLEINGEDVSGPIVIPNSGGPQAWTDVSSRMIAFPKGTVTLRIVADDDGFNLNYFTIEEPVADAVLVGAGDIAFCNTDGDERTADLLDDIDGTVFTTGDNAYPDGTPEDFTNCYDPSWGRHKDRTKPAVGNHEYVDRSAAGYFDYFGDAAGEPGKGYYSYEAGSWHVVVLNSNCSRAGAKAGCDPDSPQYDWLRRDLAAHPNSCTVAYWHHPRWSSGDYGNDDNMSAFWDLLYEAGAELVLNAHEHYYERFAPLAPDGSRDDERGIRQIIVGTGGGELTLAADPGENSEVLGMGELGVLKLTLKTSGYDWEFIPADGSSFTDSGSGSCH